MFLQLGRNTALVFYFLNTDKVLAWKVEEKVTSCYTGNTG